MTANSFLTLYGEVEDMDIAKTHLGVVTQLVGIPVLVVDGLSSVVELNAMSQMAVDGTGLTHGGFIFGLADYAAMLAVNHPNVVLGAAQVKFIAPVRSGDMMRAEATVTEKAGKKSVVNVEVNVSGKRVFSGTFTCYSLDKHVLSG